MTFNSIAFLIFCPIVLAGYWLLPFRFRKYWLLAASYFFYMYWNPILVFLLLLSTAVDYCCSIGIERWRGKKSVMKLLLMVSIFMNLGLLFTFKYADFFGETVNLLCQSIGIGYRVPKLNLILPVGISFYTFQTMSYTIDVYRGDFHAEKDPITFALYVTYFPQLVAGPIENPRNLLPQLHKEHTFNWDDFTAGGRLLLSGFFRKCVVADFCGIYVNNIFNNPGNANSLAVACAGGLFCIQIYCDFAGYSEIASGCARMMGVKLMRNFDKPYLSQSITELFRRWHISLNYWFTNYVYIPLGGSRKGKARRLLNTFIVFALCGLWHGARWTYVLWGACTGILVCLESLLDINRRFGPRWNTPVGKLLRRTGVFLLSICSSLVFRSESLSHMVVMYQRLLTQTGFGTAYLQQAYQALGLTTLAVFQLVLSLVAMYKLNHWAYREPTPAASDHVWAQRISVAVYFTLIIGMCWLALLVSKDVAGFAYFQF